MKKAILSLVLLTLTITAGAAGVVPAPINIFGRNTQSLNGPWHYIIDVQEEGFYNYRMQEMTWGHFGENRHAQRPSDLVEYDFRTSPTMTIPGDWNSQDPRLFFYEGTVWFQRTFTYEPHAGRRALLYFGAANYQSVVYVNGKKVGTHTGGFTPFCFDVTDVVRSGENDVVVKVDNKRSATAVPTEIFDWWNYGGITRDVLLVETADTYVEDYAIGLDRGAFHRGQKIINFQLRLNKPVAGRQVTVALPGLKIRKTITTDAQGQATLRLKTKAALWSPEQPTLYQLQLTMDGETINDEVGFRVIETRGKGIYLNGKKIFLRGVCAHEERAYQTARATTTADADTLISWAKAMNCNFMRLAHYPHREQAIRACERQGILVWEELPCYWTIAWTNRDTYDNAQQQLHDMIARDKNRANIIIWSIANETPHSADRDAFLSSLARYARTQDTTRLISMAMEVTAASNYVNRLNDNMNQFVDVISFNEYVGWYRDVNDAAKMTWEVPYDKPVIISEFGGGAQAGLHGTENQRWTEEFQARLYRENLAMLDKIDGLSGLTPWVLKDFRSPRRVLPGIQDYFNRKGLVSDQGQRKQAFYIMREYYGKKRSY